MNPDEHRSAKQTCSNMTLMTEAVGSTFLYYVIVLLFTRGACPQPLEKISVYAIAIFLITLVAYYITYCINENYSFGNSVKRVIFAVTFISSLMILFFHVNTPAIENFFVEAKKFSMLTYELTLMEYIYNLYVNITYIVIGCMVLRLIYSSYGTIRYNTSENRKIAKSAFYNSLALVIISLLMYVIENGISDYYDIFVVTKKHLPLVMSCAAVVVSAYVEDVVKYKVQKTAPVDQIGTVNGKGELHINYGVVKIPERAYAEHREITAVYIPETVLEIEKNAFYGCGGIENVYCNFTSKPSGWNYEWLNGCYATVHWCNINDYSVKDVSNGGFSNAYQNQTGYYGYQNQGTPVDYQTPTNPYPYQGQDNSYNYQNPYTYQNQGAPGNYQPPVNSYPYQPQDNLYNYQSSENPYAYQNPNAQGYYQEPTNRYQYQDQNNLNNYQNQDSYTDRKE